MSLENKFIIKENLKFFMDLNKKSRKDVADAIGVQYSRVSDWLQGRTYPRPDAIEKLAAYFNIKRSDLVDPRPREDIDTNNTNNIALNGSNHGAISGSGTAMVINGSPISVEQAEYCLMCHSLSSGAREQINNMIKMLHELEHKK